jgi:ketosteroid isomerase-like protein
MARANLEVVRAAFDGAEGRSLEETAEKYWHPEIEYVEDPRWPGASSYKGRESVVRCFRAYEEALGGTQEFAAIALERVFDAGDRFVPFVRFKGTGSASGVPHEHLWAYVVEVADGRIKYFRAYYEPSEALEAVGLNDAASSGTA